MPFPCFSDRPSISLLQWLARGSLKQNLSRALRLWVWLHFLYGEEGSQSELPNSFTYREWRDAFFTTTHPTAEAIPPLHDSTCRCAKTVAAWLFDSDMGVQKACWLTSLEQHDSAPHHLQTILRSRLFGVTRRSLYEDLQILCKLGWVKRNDQTYHRVEEFPSYAQSPSSNRNGVIVHPDLAAIADSLSDQINGYQRFFLHVEYIVPKHAIDQVDDWRAQLRQLWEETPVRPIQVTFYSAKLDTTCTKVVYPVCIYYVQRAPYLCAWGQLPEDDDAIDWRHYRLDRIQSITPLDWNASSVPTRLRQAYQHRSLPNPDDIQEQMAAAWGFDFYQPADTLLLRFDQNFANRYINNSLRHETFKAISYTKAKALVRSNTDAVIRQQLFDILEKRSPHDAYYTAQYRRHDLNILLRLRAWRPHMEVLLPWDLRQQIATEVKQESQFYE